MAYITPNNIYEYIYIYIYVYIYIYIHTHIYNNIYEPGSKNLALKCVEKMKRQPLS
jgi:hypothetical protein